MKYLFILFQGSGTNTKVWNEYTESKFVDKLKELGKVYIYQNKTYNVWFYDKDNKDRKDYKSDIDFDLSYFNVNKHLQLVMTELQNKYKNIDQYKLIPVGWSLGYVK